MLGLAAVQHHVAAGRGYGAQVGAGLDAVGDDGVLAAVEALDAGDGEGARADAFDLGAHLDEELGQVPDLGLLGGVAQEAVPLARAAAMRMFSVAPTLTLAKAWSMAFRRPLTEAWM